VRQTVVLVACAATKLDRPAPAQDLYRSGLFRKARRWAERHGDRWYILSAKHGLVPPEWLLEPYDRTLNQMTAAERRAWAAQALADLITLTAPGDTHLVFLAGVAYRAQLGVAAERLGYTVEAPLAGLGIGKQLAWFVQAARREHG
jgi:hypothetical protein